MFYSVGVDRQKMLRLKHWEVVAFLRSFRVQKARDILELSEGVAIGSGTIAEESDRIKVMDRLTIAAGFKEPPNPNKDEPWTKALIDYANQPTPTP